LSKIQGNYRHLFEQLADNCLNRLIFAGSHFSKQHLLEVMNKIDYTVSGFNAVPMAADLSLPDDLSNLKGIIIYAHGINGFKDWGGMNIIAEEFSTNNWAVLKFNFSHNGTTPALPEEFIDLDIYAKDSYLKRQFDLKRIFAFVKNILEGELELRFKKTILIGHSRGGPDVILHSVNNKKVDGLITWAAVAHAQTPWSKLNPDELKSWQENGVYYRSNGRTKQEMPISFELFEEWQDHHQELNVEAAARQISIPWLIIHGDEDEAVFVKDAYTLKESNIEAKVAIIEGGNHTFGRVHPWRQAALPQHSQELMTASLKFLKDL
jgi:pimeloyl-ACP methyl ester carboxylesterase